jgi:hypothetical protein
MPRKKAKTISELSTDKRRELVNKIAQRILLVQCAEMDRNVDIYDADITNAHPRTIELRNMSIAVLDEIEAFLEEKELPLKTTSRRLSLEAMFGAGVED